MTLFPVIHSWKKVISHAIVLLMIASVAEAAKYRPPLVADEEPIEEMPDEPAVPPKTIKKNGRITLVIPSQPKEPVQKEIPQPVSQKKQGPECIRTLREYNAPENKHIKAAVGGEKLFTTWYDQKLPVSITIRPEGGAIVNAPGFDTNPRDVALCLDEQGPVLKFDGHSIRLRRGPLKSIAFQFQGYNLRFTTTNPQADFDRQRVFDSVN